MEQKIIKNIKKIIIENNDNSLEKIDEELTELESSIDIDKNIINEFLYIYEEYPNFDFGVPGTLTHFLETFYKKGYEERLIESIRRTPTKHTLWMLNRIINGTNGKELKDNYIQEFHLIINNHKLDISLRELASDYMRLHKNKE